MMTVIAHKYGGRFVMSASRLFNEVFDKEWFKDPLVQEMVRDVDNTEWVAGSVFTNDVLGDIHASELSGGVKGLMLVYKNPEGISRVFSSVIWGDNCAKWLAKLSFMVDFSLYFEHILSFPEDIQVRAQTQDGRPLNTGAEIREYRWECEEEVLGGAE